MIRISPSPPEAPVKTGAFFFQKYRRRLDFSVFPYLVFIRFLFAFNVWNCQEMWSMSVHCHIQNRKLYLQNKIQLNGILPIACLAGFGIYVLSWYLSIIFYKKREIC